MAWSPVPYRILVAASGVALTHTGDTNETALASVAIPPLGANDQLWVTALWTYTNSANTKNLRIRFNSAAGVAGTLYSNAAPTTTTALRQITGISNRNATNSQIGGQLSAAYTASASANATSAIDTTVPTYVNFTCALTNSGESITLEQYTVEVIRG